MEGVTQDVAIGEEETDCEVLAHTEPVKLEAVEGERVPVTEGLVLGDTLGDLLAEGEEDTHPVPLSDTVIVGDKLGDVEVVCDTVEVKGTLTVMADVPETVEDREPVSVRDEEGVLVGEERPLPVERTLLEARTEKESRALAVEEGHTLADTQTVAVLEGVWVPVKEVLSVPLTEEEPDTETDTPGVRDLPGEGDTEGVVETVVHPVMVAQAVPEPVEDTEREGVTEEDTVTEAERQAVGVTVLVTVKEGEPLTDSVTVTV